MYRDDSTHPSIQRTADKILDYLIQNSPVLGGGDPWRPASVVLAQAIHPNLTIVTNPTQSNTAGYSAYWNVMESLHMLCEEGMISLSRQPTHHDQIYRIDLS